MRRSSQREGMQFVRSDASRVGSAGANVTKHGLVFSARLTNITDNRSPSEINAKFLGSIPRMKQIHNSQIRREKRIKSHLVDGIIRFLWIIPHSIPLYLTRIVRVHLSIPREDSVGPSISMVTQNEPSSSRLEDLRGFWTLKEKRS